MGCIEILANIGSEPPHLTDAGRPARGAGGPPGTCRDRRAPIHRLAAAGCLLGSLVFAGSSTGLPAQHAGSALRPAKATSAARPRLRGAFSLPREPDPLFPALLDREGSFPGRLRLTLQLPGLRADSSPNGSGQRLALSLNSGRLRLDGLLQELDTRVRPDKYLAAGDRKLFGNGNGIRRTALSLGYQTGTKNALSFSQTRLTAHGASAERRRIAFEGGKPFSLALETGQVDSGFDRAAQLDGIEKTLFRRERGFRWQELTAHLRLAGWAVLDGTRYRSRGEDGARRRRREQTALTLTPRAGMRILFRDEQRDEQSQPGQARQTTTRTVQWEQTLGSRTKLLALHETVARDNGEVARTQTRQSWELQTGLGKGWKLQGKLGTTNKEGASRQRSFQTSVAGALGKGWLLTAAALGRSGGDAPDMRKHTLTLTGPAGSLGGLFRKTGLSLALTSAEGVPMALVPSGSGSAKVSRPQDSRWKSLSLLAKTDLGRSLLTLGFQSFGLPGGTAGGLAFWWRSAGSRRLQWELRRTWSELAGKMLVPRERMALSYQWDRSRIGLATELNPEHKPGHPALGLRESTLDFQTRIGGTTVGLTYGTLADRVKGNTSRLRRLTLATALSHQGSLRLVYEANRTPVPTPSLPTQLLTLTARRRVAADQYLDLGIASHQWNSHAIADDLTWHLDLGLKF